MSSISFILKLKAFLLCFILPLQAFAQSSIPHIGAPKAYYGVAYYPEAWEFETVEQDIALMKEANINVVRMGEFSWNLMEPSEGKYDFQWLHQLIEQLHQNGIAVVLGTPTATPPAWMAAKYPEIFKIDQTGFQYGHGARKNTRYTSQIYRVFARKICTELAKEFGKKPGVIGWQIDNEFSLSQDYSEETKQQWTEWLSNKYGTIDKLNKIWATNLWSMEYNNFDQIPMDRNKIWHHPSLRLEWKQFFSDQVVAFQNIQVATLRVHSNLPITHDGMPGQKLNYPDLFKNLDFMATNFYHNFSVYNRVQSNFDRVRSYGKGMHWVFETAPNYSGGGAKGKTWFIHQPDGAMRAVIWMNYAMGGQGTMFWLWRQHPAGQEMPHGSFISAWGKPAANFKQLKALGQELQEQSDFLMNHPVEPADIAIFYSHKADVGLSIEQSSSQDIRYYTDWTNRFYRPLSDAFLHRDVIHEYADISKYKLIIAPMLPMIAHELIDELQQWVRDGGTLILGPMSAYRTTYWTANTNHALGKFGNWLDIDVNTRIPIDPFNKNHDTLLELEFHYENLPDNPCALWSEALESAKGSVLANYKSGMHKGQAAIIESSYGKGKVVYLGTDPGYEAMKALYLKYAAALNVSPLAKGNKDILVVPRTGEEGKHLFIINLSNTEGELEFPQLLDLDRLSGKTINKKKLTLKPFEVILSKLEDTKADK